MHYGVFERMQKNAMRCRVHSSRGRNQDRLPVTAVIVVLATALLLLFRGSRYSVSLRNADLYPAAEGIRRRAAMRVQSRLKELNFDRIRDAPRWDFATEVYLWDWFTPYWPCTDTERLGRVGDGGKWICGMSELELKSGCIVYSFGVRTEASFEAELADRTECRIFAHDPSVAELPKAAQGRANIHFARLGVASGPSPGYDTLVSIMRRQGHAVIDVLKMDIEGAEKTVLPALLDSHGGFPFKQLLLEVHHSEKDPNSTYALFEALEAGGAVPFMNEFNHVPCINKELPKVVEYSFLVLQPRGVSAI